MSLKQLLTSGLFPGGEEADPTMPVYTVITSYSIQYTKLYDGAWGLMRAYNGGLGLRPDLAALPNNPDGKSPRNNFV